MTTKFEAGQKAYYYSPANQFFGVLVPIEVTVMRVEQKVVERYGVSEVISEYTIKNNDNGAIYITDGEWLKATPQ